MEPTNQEILQKIHKLMELFHAGALGGEIMPEDANPKLARDSIENYLYFTLPMALNYQRSAYALWESAYKTYCDAEIRDVFFPETVSRMDIYTLREKLVKHPGHGADKSPIEEQSLENYARAVEAMIAPLEESVILVGHSFGGMITSQVACYSPNKIKKLVYVAAFLPKNGQSCVGITKSLRPTFHEKLVESGYDFILSADGKTSKIPPEAGADFVFSDMPKDIALVMAERLGAESNAAQQQTVALNHQFNDIPKAYVRCIFDKTIAIELQDKMIAEACCNEVYTLQTGHCPFASAPGDLAEILLCM